MMTEARLQKVFSGTLKILRLAMGTLVCACMAVSMALTSMAGA